MLFDFDSFNIYFLISDILLTDVAQLPQISLFKLKIDKLRAHCGMYGHDNVCINKIFWFG